MIIFGTYTIRHVLGEGTFCCPNCRRNAAYRMRRPKLWGHLYFVPLIPVKTYDEYVECRACATAYQPAVLQLFPESSLPEYLPAAQPAE
jgi:hypothetical protein